MRNEKEFKSLNENLIISQWNEDPLMSDLTETSDNINKLKKDTNLSKEYLNISFLPEQYDEAVIRLFLHFANLKIDEWANQIRNATQEAAELHDDAISIEEWESAMENLKAQLAHARTQ